MAEASLRLFIALWPPPDVLAAVAGLARPDLREVRWTVREQWHVTLRFLGEVSASDVAPLEEVVAGVAAGLSPPQLTLGPALQRLRRTRLVVPVSGAGDVAVAVVAATAGIGRPPDERPFHGHLTLARARGRAVIPASLARTALHLDWTADSLSLVRSRLDPDRARYDTLLAAPFAGVRR
jgi:2'-5' RNA ligase